MYCIIPRPFPVHQNPLGSQGTSDDWAKWSSQLMLQGKSQNAEYADGRWFHRIEQGKLKLLKADDVSIWRKRLRMPSSSKPRDPWLP
ncbi:uncharacterized protein J3R85_006387 [Psidium guajava]|nr:uncharacterized protein J3R85_006387 [Psidium guajava]